MSPWLRMFMSKFASLVFLPAMLTVCGPPRQNLRLVTFTGAEAPLLADKLGYFAAEGLKVEVQETPGTSRAMEALLSGSAQSIVGTFEQVLQLQAKGQDVVAYSLLTECHCLALVSPTVKSISGLKGKIIGVGGAGGPMQSFVEFLLEKEGLPRGSVSFAGVGVGPTAVAAIEGGKVDAGVVLASALVQLRTRNPKLNTIAETFTPAGSARVFGQSRYPAMALIAKRDFLRAQPDVAKRLVRSLQRAVAWIQENGPEGVHRELPATNLDALRMHLPRYAAWAEIQPGDVQTAAKYLKIDTAPERTFVNDFVRSARAQ